MNVSFQGIDDLVATFHAASGVKKGDFVTMSADGTVRACNLGDGVVGRVLGVRSGFAAVQLRGCVEAEYLSTLSLGWQDVTSQGSKLVPAGANDTPRRALVLSLDTTAKKVVALLW